MDDNNFWYKIWVIVGVCTCVGFVSLAAYNAYATYRFTEKGYVEQVQPGSQTAKWVLP